MGMSYRADARTSPPGEIRRAPLAEGSEPFRPVSGAEQYRHGLTLVGDRRVQVHAEALVDEALARRERKRGAGRQLTGQAEGGRPRGRYGLAGEDHLPGDPGREEPRLALRAAGARQHAKLHLR